MARIMKALSVRQAWANMIASGAKTIETRLWYTSYRGELLICSSKKPDIHPAGYALATCRLIRAIRPFPVKGQLGIFEVEMPGGGGKGK